MMDFSSFKSEFVTSCEACLSALVDPGTEDAISIEERCITKAQHGELSGLVFRSSGFFCAPTVYVEDFYKLYREGLSVEELSAHAVSSVYPYIRCAPTFPEDAFDDPANLRVRLLHRARNRGFLKTVPYREAGCGFTLVAEVRTGEYRAVVTNELLGSLGISEDELFDTALGNSSVNDPPALFELSDLICSGKDDSTNLLDSAHGMHLPAAASLYLLSNDKCFWGAAALFYPGVMEKLYSLMGGDFYMLPSSVHEVMLLSVSDGDPRKLTDTLRSANRSVVSEDEFLSDDLYICEGGKLKRVSYGGIIPLPGICVN